MHGALTGPLHQRFSLWLMHAIFVSVSCETSYLQLRHAVPEVKSQHIIYKRMLMNTRRHSLVACMWLICSETHRYCFVAGTPRCFKKCCMWQHQQDRDTDSVEKKFGEVSHSKNDQGVGEHCLTGSGAEPQPKRCIFSLLMKSFAWIASNWHEKWYGSTPKSGTALSVYDE